MVYYTLGNIYPKYRSKLVVIRLLAMARSADLRQSGVDVILNRIRKTWMHCTVVLKWCHVIHRNHGSNKDSRFNVHQYSRIIVSVISRITQSRPSIIHYHPVEYKSLTRIIIFTVNIQFMSRVCVCVEIQFIRHQWDFGIHSCSNRTNLWRLSPISVISHTAPFGIPSHIPYFTACFSTLFW